MKNLLATSSLILVVICLSITSESVAQNSLLEVYMNNNLATRLPGDARELVVYGEQTELDYLVVIGNEEGSLPVNLSPDLHSTAEVRVEIDGVYVPSDEIEIIWGDQHEKYPSGVDQSDEEDVHLIEPGAYVHFALTVKRTDGRYFKNGSYNVSVFLKHSLTLVNGDPWKGRGGRGGDRFRLLIPVTQKDFRSQQLILASRYTKERKFDDAAATYLELIKLSPNDQGMWDHLGIIYTATGDYARAIECFYKIFSHPHRPGHSPVPFTAARAFVGLQEEEEARLILREYYSESEVDGELIKMKQSLEKKENRTGSPK